jgi:hypothetical protein
MGLDTYNNKLHVCCSEKSDILSAFLAYVSFWAFFQVDATHLLMQEEYRRRNRGGGYGRIGLWHNRDNVLELARKN